MSKIFCHSHRSSRIHPQRQRHQSAPESYLSRHTKPEEHRPDDHVQNLQADENDHQQKRDGGEVRFRGDTVHDGAEDEIGV